MSSFCHYCGSLMPPNSDRCRSCGRIAGGSDKVDDYDIPKEVIAQPKIISPENAKAPFFPYEPRDMQLQIVNDIVSALDSENHIVMESGTGTGKTIVSLAGVLQHAFSHHKRVVYLTRTISQSDQVMRELRAISTLKKVTGMTVTGRSRSCPLLRTIANYETMHPSVLANLCEDNKKKTNMGQAGCRYYAQMKLRLDEVEDYCTRTLPTSEEIDKFCEERDICPYETKKSLLKQMDVVVAPYVHILSEDIRSGFLGNMESDGSNLVVIVDEAHNIIDAAREQESYSIPMSLIDAALDETTTMRGDPPVFDNVLLRPFIGEIKNIIKSLANDLLSFTKKEEIIPTGSIEMKLKKRFDLNDTELKSAVDRMVTLGEDRTEMLIDKGDNRVSDIFTLGIGLKNWISSEQSKYIKSVKASDDGESLHAACIDPYDVTSFLRSMKGAVHMSGTLEPLDQYVKIMGLPKTTVMKTYPSPFPPENRSVIYLGNVTTRYDDMQKDPSIFSRMEKNIAKLCNNVDKNTLVFFPSYSMMSKMRPFLERDVKKDVYWEESKQQRRTMLSLSKFRAGRNGVFFTVMGGSIAEGIDFPGEELCFAIIVGIPYPPPTLEMKAMSKMFDEKYGAGTGWRYTSEVPALRKMKQAIGRLIRTETDRGMAVIFDSRASKYTSRLDAKLSTDPLHDVIVFFEKENK